MSLGELAIDYFWTLAYPKVPSSSLRENWKPPRSTERPRQQAGRPSWKRGVLVP